VLSEFTSNVAAIQLMLPVLAALSVSLQVPALQLMVPATLAASSGFMLHVATAPNTIVYGSGLIKSNHMLRAGLVLDVTFILLVTAAILLFGF
jgi:solute carrier family 13 (sodium-dependent dicarboxylate transporter), member 2/3/5